jgi:hypothetical protein
MISDTKTIKPWAQFPKYSDGGFILYFMVQMIKKGDIVIVCSYTKFILEMESQGKTICVQNIFWWLGCVEKYQMKNGCKDSTEFRPLQIVLNVKYSANGYDF